MKLGVLSDIHRQAADAGPASWFSPYPTETVLDRLRQSLEFLSARGVAAIAVLGDLSTHGDVESIREVISVLGESGLPTWIIPGNHDLMQEPANFTQALELANTTNIAIPTGTDARWNGWRIYATAITRVEGHRYRLASAPDIASWGTDPVMILSHFPVVGFGDAARKAGLKYAGDYVDGESVANAFIARADPILALHGHLHIRNTLASGAVLQISCGAQIDALYEVTVVDFGRWSDSRIDWTATPIQAVYPEISPALSEPNQAWSWNGSAWSPISH